MSIYGGGLVPILVDDPDEIQSRKKFELNAQIDWSQPNTWPSPYTFDFGTQAYGQEMRYVRGAWIDNSASTNDLIISFAMSNQQLRVYAGSVVTIPIFAWRLPRIVIQNMNNGTANVGLVNILFTSWELPPCVLVPGNDEPVTTVLDSAVLALMSSSPGQFSQEQFAQLSGPTQTLSTVLTAATVLLLAGNQVSSWAMWQNVGANSCGIVFTAVTTPTLTAANSILIPPGGQLTTAQLGIVPTSKVWAYSAAGTTLNMFYH